MAPEMARGPVEKIDHTSDIYLLGAILYEIIGGQPPHSGRDVMQCLMTAAQNQIDGIRYEGELKSIALRAMATRQEDRYPSVKDFRKRFASTSRIPRAWCSRPTPIRICKRPASRATTSFLPAHCTASRNRSRCGMRNERARVLLAETQHDYAECALDKGDLDLAASLLDERQHRSTPSCSPRSTSARAERDARQRRLRLAKQAVAALM